jgi:hypothetical protein
VEYERFSATLRLHWYKVFPDEGNLELRGAEVLSGISILLVMILDIRNLKLPEFEEKKIYQTIQANLSDQGNCEVPDFEVF